jgi:hypothetical protein
MAEKIGVFGNYKKQKEIDEQQQTLDYLAESNDKILEGWHKKAEEKAGHELTILNSLRKKWHVARQEFRDFSYDKELTRDSSAWTQEMIMELGREAKSYVEEAKRAKKLYTDKLQEHLTLLGISDNFKK